jgi:hypothetical protein
MRVSAAWRLTPAWDKEIIFFSYKRLFSKFIIILQCISNKQFYGSLCKKGHITFFLCIYYILTDNNKQTSAPSQIKSDHYEKKTLVFIYRFYHLQYLFTGILNTEKW